jgi:hypothetical protein
MWEMQENAWEEVRHMGGARECTGGGETHGRYRRCGA